VAITTLDGFSAGNLPPTEFFKVGTAPKAAGVLHSQFYASGNPQAAAIASPGLNGAALTSYAGMIPFTNPGSGYSYLSRLVAWATVSCSLLVCDRLWHNSGIAVTTTGAQGITTPTWPTRDKNGATAGVGIMVGLEVTAATTNAGAVTNCTLAYTGDDGNTGTATMASFPATASLGTFVPFQFDGTKNHGGVRAISGLTLGTSLVTGSVALVAYRVLTMIGLTANIVNQLDILTGSAVRLYDNTVPFILQLPTATTATTIGGHLIVAQG